MRASTDLIPRPHAGLGLAVFSVVMLLSSSAAAQDGPARRVEVSFTPTLRSQLAIWIESEDGTVFRTLGLTSAVAYRGIGNRPGALQMNSGFRWPYGRREGALPVWGHRRIEATGVMFPRVIFAGRASEGHASNAQSPGEVVNTPDDFFCLSFRSGDESLDAVSCASVFMSNKGRYLTEADVSAGYAEPWQSSSGSAGVRALGLGSPYPPRQDLRDCPRRDHADVCRYIEDAHAVMPDLDAVTMATPAAGAPFGLVFDVPPEWPEGEYVLFVETNTEGDHNEAYGPTSLPTPCFPYSSPPDGACRSSWDSWSATNGYPYRGQPSVVYRVPFTLSSRGGAWSEAAPTGYGDLNGDDGEMHAMDGTVRDAPSEFPGSGADRLILRSDSTRVRVTVPTWDVCSQPEPPPDCGRECDTARPCADPLLCGPDGTCVGICDVPLRPAAPRQVMGATHEDRGKAHRWGHLSIEVPALERRLMRWEVRVSTDPITDIDSFLAGVPANTADDVTQDGEALVLPTVREDGTPLQPGDVIDIDVGGLQRETHYWIGVRVFDECNAGSAVAVGELDTSSIRFTTVSPCFVATAAYGSALEPRIGVLRRFRDRHLRSHGPGRALVSLYESVGPTLAGWVEGDEALRGVVQSALSDVVSLLEWWDDESL